MKHNYNNLVRRYNKCRRKLANLIYLGRNKRRQGILINHIERLKLKLYSLKLHNNKNIIATSVLVSAMAFIPTAEAQVTFEPFDPPFFPQPLDVGVSSSPAFIDIDNDGDMDLVSGEAYTGTFRFYQNNGVGFFNELTGADNPFNGFSVGLGSTPTFGDVDGDGDIDLVSGEYDGAFYFFQNDGAGNFTEITGTANPFNSFNVDNRSTPNLIDLDGDGDIDMVSGEYDGIFSFFQNDGAGSFAEITGAANPFNGFNVGDRNTPTFVDVDDDGDLDLVSGENLGNFYFFQNDGAGNFTEITGAANPFNGFDIGYRSTPAFLDIDSDGDMDLVSGEDIGLLNIFQNDGAGIFTELLGNANSFNGFNIGLFSNPTFADGDGDGDVDLVSGEYDGIFNLFKNDGMGFLSEATGNDNPFNNFNIGYLSSPSFADVDGDGDIDLVSGEYNGAFRFFENDGNGTYSEMTDAANPFNGFVVGDRSIPSFADVDGDGDADMISGESSGIFRFFTNEGDGSFTEATGNDNPFNGFNNGLSSNPTFVDIDSDGDMDVVSGVLYGTFSFYENDGMGSFMEVEDAANPFNNFDIGYFSAPSFADIDGDGDMDLISGNYDGNFIAFENTSTLATASFTTQEVTLYPNPTDRFIEIVASESINSITITDIAGRNVYSLQFDGEENQIRLDMLNFGAAVYFVEIKTALGKMSKQVIKK